MNDPFIFDDQSHDPEKYRDLFLTTGWNLEYFFKYGPGLNFTVPQADVK